MLSSRLGRLSAAIHAHPFKAALWITTTKTVAADLVVQLAVERKEWNPWRSCLFGTFGCAYQGAAQYAIVNGLLEPLFPGKSLRNVLLKICGMNFVCDPLLFLPTFYIFKEALGRGEVTVDGALRALACYRGNALDDCRNSWVRTFWDHPSATPTPHPYHTPPHPYHTLTPSLPHPYHPPTTPLPPPYYTPTAPLPPLLPPPTPPSPPPPGSLAPWTRGHLCRMLTGDALAVDLTSLIWVRTPPFPP